MSSPILSSYAFASNTKDADNIFVANSISGSQTDNASLINVVDLKTNSATINWNTDSILNNFQIYQYNLISNTWDLYASTCTNYFTISNLVSDTYYKFRVTTLSDNSILGESFVGDVSFRTIPSHSLLKVEDVFEKSIKLSIKSDVNPTTYDIYRSTNDEHYKLISTISGDETSFTDKDLKKHKKYYYKVISVVNSNGYIANSDYSNKVEAKTTKKMDLPNVSGKCKTYAYYTAVTNRRSPAYAVLNSGTYNGVKYNTYTDEKTGIRMVDDCYCVALGTYYGTEKGTKYKITLSSGKTFKIILCDTKADRHTDSKHQYSVHSKDILEFYVEKSKIPSTVRGSYDALDQFNGSITSIEKL